MGMGVAGASSYTMARDWSGGNPTRYPDPDVISLDPRINKYRLGNASIRRVYSSPNMLWAEGPLGVVLESIFYGVIFQIINNCDGCRMMVR